MNPTLAVIAVPPPGARATRSYILVIAPFHRWVVRSARQRAARTSWPRMETTA